MGEVPLQHSDTNGRDPSHYRALQTTFPTGVPRSQGHAPLKYPTVGVCLGSCGGPEGEVLFYGRGDSLHGCVKSRAEISLCTGASHLQENAPP